MTFILQDVAYAQSPARTTFRDPYGWLASLINNFGMEGGFDIILYVTFSFP